jgi:O-antigen/teichoic acid export membrane protein
VNTGPGKSIAFNSVANLLTQAALVLVAIWSIPKLTSGLGQEGFGVLSLIWSLVGYFSLLDFGTSRAATKFVAEGAGGGDRDRQHRAIWGALSFSALIGFTTSAVLAAAASLLTNHVLEVSAQNRDLFSNTFAVAAIGIPFMLLYATITGSLMAVQQFVPVNVLRGVMGLFQWVGSVVLLWLGMGIWEIIVMTVIVRVVVTIIAFFSLSHHFPDLLHHPRLFDWSEIRRLFSFGSWVMVSQVVSPLFLYVDRLLIGSLISVSAVAFYTLPQDALSRLSIIPLSLSATLFPALTQQIAGKGIDTSSASLYARSFKYLFHVMLPLQGILFVFAYDILFVWVGHEYADGSTVVFRIIVAGFLFNALAQLPATALHAMGRPDLPAKFHIVEFLVMVLLNLLLIPSMGIAGVALVWSVRVFADALLLTSAVQVSRGPVLGNLAGILSRLAIAALITGLLLSIKDIEVQIGVAGLLTFVYVLWVWRYVLDVRDKVLVKTLVRPLIRIA